MRVELRPGEGGLVSDTPYPYSPSRGRKGGKVKKWRICQDPHPVGPVREGPPSPEVSGYCLRPGFEVEQ